MNTTNKNNTGKTVTVLAAGKLSVWMKLLLALVSLFLGILTPPFVMVRAETQDTAAATNEEEPTCVVNADGSSSCKEGVENTLGSGEALFPCTEATLSHYLHDEPVFGYHVVCFSTIHNEEKHHKDYLQVTYYINGFRNKTITQTFPKPYKWKHAKFGLKRKLTFEMEKLVGEFQPWAMFTPMGQRVVDGDVEGEEPEDEDEEADQLILDVLLRFQTMLVYEGGQFVWPGVAVDYERNVNLYSIMPPDDPQLADQHRIVTLKTMSLRPLVLQVDGFLTEEECEYIQTKAAPTMAYSGVVLMDHDKGRPASDFRTSQSTFVSSQHDPTMLDIEYRTASLVRISRHHQEDVQVLRYGQGEKYDAHHDWFDPNLYQNDENTLELIGHGARNRLATVFWYLSDVEEGGETVFPRLNGMVPTSMQDCSQGLKVKPKKGRVIIFYSLLPSGKPDPLSLHGACPVKEGIKWAANKWVWNEPMGYVHDVSDE